jgi:Uma2 family endonuclease
MRRELIDGEIAGEASVGPLHEQVKTLFGRKLDGYLEVRNLPGLALAEARFPLSEAPQPEIALVLSSRLDAEHTGRITAVPDLVVEVVSSDQQPGYNGRCNYTWSEACE